MFPFAHLRVFVATSREAVPSGCARYISVDGSVPGAAVTWDHHVTGELINLMAMPAVFDATGYDGVGTTLADTDALASILAVMAGGRTRLPPNVLQVLEAASHRCDHLAPLPGASRDVEELGRGLHGFVSDALARVAREDKSAELERLCRLTANCIADAKPLPFDTTTYDENRRRAEAADAAGVIIRGEHVTLLDLRGRESIAPEATYERISSPLVVAVDTHRDGGRRYTVGVNPFVADAPDNLRAALEALSAAEFAHGPPAEAKTPTPGAENWGGRATVFGSPWNYGSRLSPEEVVDIVERTVFDGQRARRAGM